MERFALHLERRCGEPRKLGKCNRHTHRREGDVLALVSTSRAGRFTHTHLLMPTFFLTLEPFVRGLISPMYFVDWSVRFSQVSPYGPQIIRIFRNSRFLFQKSGVAGNHVGIPRASTSDVGISKIAMCDVVRKLLSRSTNVNDIRTLGSSWKLDLRWVPKVHDVALSLRMLQCWTILWNISELGTQNRAIIFESRSSGVRREAGCSTTPMYTAVAGSHLIPDHISFIA